MIANFSRNLSFGIIRLGHSHIDNVIPKDDEPPQHVSEDASHVTGHYHTCGTFDRLDASFGNVSRLTYVCSIPVLDDDLAASCYHNIGNIVAAFLPS